MSKYTTKNNLMHIFHINKLIVRHPVRIYESAYSSLKCLKQRENKFCWVLKNYIAIQ